MHSSRYIILLTEVHHALSNIMIETFAQRTSDFLPQVFLYDSASQQCFNLTATVAAYCPAHSQLQSSISSWLLIYSQFSGQSQASFISYAITVIYTWLLLAREIISNLALDVQKNWVYYLNSYNSTVTTFSAVTTFITTLYLFSRRYFYTYKFQTPTMAGLLGGGGPLGAVSGLTGGDGPLGAVSGLTGGGLGDTLGRVAGGGLGDTLGGVTGLAGGLLGGGEGLNLVGLVGIGSDDPALLDLNPAEKKTVKAQKAAMAAKRKQQREQA